MVKAFEGKYAGVKVEAYRVSGSDMTVRMMEEAKAKRYIVDAVETTEGNLMFMREAFLLRPYHSPHFASYPEDAKEKGERGLYSWGIARESYIGFAYNKKLLSKSAVPKNYEGPATSGTKRPHGSVRQRSCLQGRRCDCQDQRHRTGQKAQDTRDRPPHDHSPGASRSDRIG